MDTAFVIDSSLCDSESNWNRLLYFVQTLVKYFNVSPSGGRIALIPYGTDASVVLKFNTLTGSSLNDAEVKKQLDRLRCMSGFRRIDKALDLVDKEVLTPAGGMRGVSRVRGTKTNNRAVRTSWGILWITSLSLSFSYCFSAARVCDHNWKANSRPGSVHTSWSSLLSPSEQRSSRFRVGCRRRRGRFRAQRNRFQS